MSDLTDEIIEEIIARLPAKSVVCFNLVCKQWQSLISHPDVIKHLNHVLLDQSSNNHHKLIVNTSPAFCSVDYCNCKSTKRDFPLQYPHVHRILGYCSGLLLIGFYDQKCRFDPLVLCNPLFGHYNLLPQCSSISSYVRMLGFGYDSSINYFKAVKVITSDLMHNVEQKVEIYTLKTNTWKMIQGVIPYDNIYLYYHNIGTFVTGYIYWIVTNVNYLDADEFDNLMLAFDLIDEKFRLVGAPRDDLQPTWGCKLVEVRGCLGFYQTEYSFRDVIIWILKEDETNNEYWR